VAVGQALFFTPALRHCARRFGLSASGRGDSFAEFAALPLLIIFTTKRRPYFCGAEPLTHMRARYILLPVLVLGLTVGAFAAQDPESAPSMKDVIKARLADEAQHKPAAATAPTAPAPAPAKTDETAASPVLAKPASGTSTTPKPTPQATKAATPPPAEPPTILPKVEVRKSRITELDHQLALKDQEIAREKKNTKPSEVDQALNDAKIAKPLAILGGESSQFRAHVAKERVGLMEEEKDLLEAIAHAKTKKEKEALQKQLDELQATRRELEKTLR
jgi:hypothetical protein